MIIPPSILILNSKKEGIMKTGVKQLYDVLVRKVSIRCILNSKKGNKLIRFLKGNEHNYYEIVSNVPFRVRKEIETILDNSNIILNAYS